MIARIIVDISTDRLWDYQIPQPMLQNICIGMKVIVPFRNQQKEGFIIDLVEKSQFPHLKSIYSICLEFSPVPQNLIRLGKWIADYYCCAQELAIKNLLPGAVRNGKVKQKFTPFCTITDEEKALEYIETKGKQNKAKARVLQTLIHFNELSVQKLKQKAETSNKTIKDLISLELITEEKKELNIDPFADVKIIKSAALRPTDEQKKCLDMVSETISELENCEVRKPHTILIHGVTGSGKTEVYLQAISKVLEIGKESIVLVPEISLTPQTVERFRARFGNMVCVLHSGLSDRERFEEWNKVTRGEVKIAVGARSALFAPFKNLGLIIVDEEHENSYKQDKPPRYNARDVAVMRGYMENATVLLGSATPSFESYWNAKQGKYKLATIFNRVDNISMPSVEIIDMCQERVMNGDGNSVFSKSLRTAIDNRLLRREQVILFLNRRGYSKEMQCSECGFVATCDNCSISYKYHRKKNTLSCHLCGMIVQAPAKCPDCSSDAIHYPGLGTEKIERMTNAVFPNARVARMDSDTMTKAKSYEEVLNKFKRGQIDILIGTQMIAKGLHFPSVTLVGVISADMGLFIPDFRAGENTFQLITQVAGRAGRGDIPGEVILQTYSPYNPAIQCAAHHDYVAYFDEDIGVREQLLYPPVADMAVIHFKGENETTVAEFANKIYNEIMKYRPEHIIPSEPCPSPIEMIKKEFRWQITFRGENFHQFRKTLRHIILNCKLPKKTKVYIDIDAINMM